MSTFTTQPLTLTAAQVAVFRPPFDCIVKIPRCFQQISTVVVGVQSTVEIREGTTVRGTFTIPAAAALDTSSIGVSTTGPIEFHVAAGTAVNFVVTTGATSGATRITVEYSPAVGL